MWERLKLSQIYHNKTIQHYFIQAHVYSETTNILMPTFIQEVYVLFHVIYLIKIKYVRQNLLTQLPYLFIFLGMKATPLPKWG